jgi:hypothetical protein
MFFASQVAYILAHLICILAGTRYNVYIGIPDVMLFLLSGNFAVIFEKGFSHFGCVLIFAKLVPVGIESSMSSIKDSVVLINLFILRNIMGVILNRAFFNVTRDNLEEGYLKLKLISLAGTFTPLLYMWYLIPTNQEAH